MNTGFFCHISEETLETYALGRVLDAQFEPLDEHLLLCPACQIRLEELEEYIEVMRAATARVSCAVLRRLQFSTVTTPPGRPAASNTRGNTDKPSIGME
jgi:hypothetical protein